MESGNDRVFPLLRDFPFAPDEGGKSVELQQNGPVILKSEFQQFRGKAVRPHFFASTIALIAVAMSSSEGSILRELATGCCSSPFGMQGSSMLLLLLLYLTFSAFVANPNKNYFTRWPVPLVVC